MKLKRGWYWLKSQHEDEPTLVFYYKNPDTDGFGFGFNIADGCGFLPESHLSDDTDVLPATITAPGQLNSAEAVFGFAAWLTSRDETIIMSSGHDAAPVAERVGEFIEANGLGDVSEQWPKHLIHPAS